MSLTIFYCDGTHGSRGWGLLRVRMRGTGCRGNSQPRASKRDIQTCCGIYTQTTFPPPASLGCSQPVANHHGGREPGRTISAPVFAWGQPSCLATASCQSHCGVRLPPPLSGVRSARGGRGSPGSSCTFSPSSFTDVSPQ